MTVDLPKGVNATKVPTLDRLNDLTDQEVYQCIRWWSEDNYASVGAQFWIDELSRRRTERVLNRIAETTAEDADHVRRLSDLTAAGAEQNAEMVRLNRRMAWLALANVVLASAAAAAAVLALTY